MRKQVNDLQAPDRLQTLARPNVATETVSKPNNAGGRLAALASGLGIGATIATGEADRAKEEERKNAEDFFNSHTPEQIGKMTRDGKLPADKNPIWVAHVQHLQGTNELSRVGRDTANGIETGDLQFRDEAELDAYMTTQRNEILQSYGRNEYVVGGFDKNYQDIKQRLLGVHSKNRTSDAMFEGELTATESLKNLHGLEYESDEDFTKAVQDQWNVVKERDHLISNERGAEVFSQAFAIPLIERGEFDKLDALLKTKTADGHTFETIIGSSRAMQYRNLANKERMRVASVQSIQNNKLLAQQAIQQGDWGKVDPEVSYLKPDGSMATMKKEDLLDQATIDAYTGQFGAMPNKLDAMAQNKIVDPRMKQLLTNSKVTLFDVFKPQADGSVGKVSEEGIAAVELFAEMKESNPGMIELHLKSEKDRQNLDDVVDLMEHGMNINEAASTVAEAVTSGIEISHGENFKDAVDAAVDEAIDPDFGLSWFGSLFEFGANASNSPMVKSKLQRMSSLLFRSGKVDSAENGANLALRKLRDSNVTSIVNGRLYYNEELPKIDTNHPIADVMTDFIETKFEETIEDPWYWFDTYPKIRKDKSGAYALFADDDMPLVDEDNKPISFTEEEINSWATEHYTKQAIEGRKERDEKRKHQLKARIAAG